MKRLPKLVISLDCDGTVFDPWACCGRTDSFEGTERCRHLRHDTLEKVRNIQAVYPKAKLVVLSWRSGMEPVTRRWLHHVGIDVAAVFVPGSPDSKAIGAYGIGQIGFKVGVVRALAARGTEVLTGFDDNSEVIEALRTAGVPALLVPHLVDREALRLAWA